MPGSKASDTESYNEGTAAWLSVFGSFLGYMLVSMGLSSVGAFYRDLLVTFSESQARTAWTASLQIAVGAILGIFICPQVKKYGCRAMTRVGSILGCSGYILASFSTNLTHLYCTFGVLVGIGNGFLFFSSAVNIQVQFTRHRSLATAIATCGVSLAMFVFPPLARLLTDVYGWRGCVVNLAAIYLNGLLAAQLMVGTDVKCLDSPKCQEKTSDSDTTSDASTKSSEGCKSSKIKNSHEASSSEIQTSEATPSSELKNSQATPSSDLQISDAAPSSDLQISHAPPSSKLHNSDTTKSTELPNVSLANEFGSQNTIQEAASLKDQQNSPFLSLPVFPMSVKQHTSNGSNNSILVDTLHPNVFGSIKWNCGLQANKPNYLNSDNCIQNSLNSLYTHSKGSIRSIKPFIKNFINFLKDALNFNLLMEFKFDLFLCGSVLNMFGYLIPILYLPLRSAYSLGLTDMENTKMLSAIGISITCGRLISGTLGDCWLSKLRAAHYGVPIMLVGALNILSAMFTSFAQMMFYSIMYGFLTGFYFVAQQPLLVELLGVEKFAKSFGIFTLFTGHVTLLCQPFAGLLVDVSGSYELPFIVCGILQLIGGFLVLGTTIFSKLYRCCKKEENKNTVPEIVEIKITQV